MAVERPGRENFREESWLTNHQLHKAVDVAIGGCCFGGNFSLEGENPELEIFLD